MFRALHALHDFLSLIASRHQTISQLREHTRRADERATEAEQRLAEERDSNAVRTYMLANLNLCAKCSRRHLFSRTIAQKLWEKISTIQRQLQKMTRPLVK